MYCKTPKSKGFIAIRAIIHRRLYKLSSDAFVTKSIKVFRVCMAHCLTCKKEGANALFYPCKHNIVCYGCSNKLGSCPTCQVSALLCFVFF